MDKDDDDAPYNDGTITSDTSSLATERASEGDARAVVDPQPNGSEDTALALDGNWEMKTGGGIIAYGVCRPETPPTPTEYHPDSCG